MKTIKVVIGANFGDEGKGLMTDYLAYRIADNAGGSFTQDEGRGNGIVVRFNGGAQAGHTVTAPDGSRHVFGHFCSGSFAGLPGYLSEFFVVNPMLFLKELEQLKRIVNVPGSDELTEYREVPEYGEVPECAEAPGRGEVPEHKKVPGSKNSTGINTRLYVDKSCMVTTPYDMMINQIAETSRGTKKHGSCGVGFNETITRCLYDKAYSLCVNDLLDEEVTRRKLIVIRNEYIRIRLEQLGITSIPQAYAHLIANEAILESFVKDVADMRDQVEVTGVEVLMGFDNIIFEGAQGLLLDQSHEYFPHVTRSNTGIRNVAELMTKMIAVEKAAATTETAATTEAAAANRTRQIEVVYVTRAYVTRHGAGPFPAELPMKPYPDIVDMTNVPNPYQDVLRYGLMDIDALDCAIKRDLANIDGFDCKVRLAITCLDQLEERVDFIVGRGKKKATVDEFLKILYGKLRIDKGYLSYGPSRETIQDFTMWK